MFFFDKIFALKPVDNNVDQKCIFSHSLHENLLKFITEYSDDRLPAFLTGIQTGSINLGGRTNSNDSGISVSSNYSISKTEDVSFTILQKKKVNFESTPSPIHYTTSQFVDDTKPDRFRSSQNNRKIISSCFRAFKF